MSDPWKVHREAVLLAEEAADKAAMIWRAPASSPGRSERLRSALDAAEKASLHAEDLLEVARRADSHPDPVWEDYHTARRYYRELLVASPAEWGTAYERVLHALAALRGRSCAHVKSNAIARLEDRVATAAYEFANRPTCDPLDSPEVEGADALALLREASERLQQARADVDRAIRLLGSG